MQRVKDLALKYKIFLGYAVIIVLFIFLGIYFVSFTFKISKSSRNIETNVFSGIEIESNLEVTFHDLTALENSLSFILYGDDKLNSINSQIKELVEKFLIHISELRDIHPDNDVIAELENRFKLYSTQVFSKIEAQRRGEIEVLVYDNSAAKDVGDIINTLRDVDIAGLSVALGSIDKFAEILRSSYLAILVFCIFISILISFFIARLIVKPIKGLLLAQRKVGEGELNYEFKVESTDEIGQLQKGFLDMAKRLVLLYKQIEDERNSLEEKVEERTLALQVSYEKIEEHNRSLEDTVKERTASLTKTIAEADKQRIAILNILEDVGN